MTTAEMYRLLELEEGAGPAEVKKAYFRLIRKYPPEQNPEAFRQLRSAYEALKDGPPKEQKSKPDWVTWKNPVVGYMLELADRCDEEEDYDKACDIIGDALKIEPDNVMLHLLMARYQMYGEHPQNAAKYAEFVTQHLPDNREAWMLLANGLQNRGWYKKALPAFRKAYDLGCRDPGFLMERISNLAQNGETEAADDLYKQFIESTPCNDDTRMILLEAFHRWADIVSPRPGRISDYLRLYDRFVRKEGKKLDPWSCPSPLIEMTNERLDVIRDRTNRHRLRQSIQLLAELQLYPEKRAAEHIGYIRNEYPELAENYAPFLEAVEKNETDLVLKKLQWEFGKLSDRYTGSRYEEMYGNAGANREERRRKKSDWAEMGDALVDDIITAPAEDPYVRENEKIGRNDPCPCGSGKKFKKCCMGKGIYD